MNNHMIKYKIKNWLYRVDNNNKTLYSFIDRLSYDICQQLEANGLKLNIPFFVFKQRISLFLYKDYINCA